MYNDFTPSVFDEHDDDGRALDVELIGNTEILGAEQEAIVRTIKRCRDNRRSCPPMKAVDLQAPLERDHLGEAIEAAPGGPYPITVSLLEKHRAAGVPRIVQVHTEKDYQAFRDATSPERTALLARLVALEEKVAAHIADPEAHDRADIVADLADAVALGEAVEAVEEEKRIPLRMQRRFDGLLESWLDGGMVASTLILPHEDGGRWFVTAAESCDKGELEAAKAATEAGVPAAAIVGYLGAIGANLAAADAVKSIASGSDGNPGSILRRPEAKGHESFLVRLDPQVSPAVFALAELACLCQQGSAQACGEWNALAAAAPLPVRQAMGEILASLKAPTSIGGAVADFFTGLWAKIRRLFTGSGAALAAPPNPSALPPAGVKQLQAISR